MILKAVRTGMLESNCYILGDGGEAAVIDPGAEHEEIMQVLEVQGLALKYIIYTHGHIDHVAEGDILRSLTGAKVVAHEDEARILEDPVLNGSAVFWSAREMGSADITVKGADVLELGDAKLEIIHTPGHTPGGICVLVREAVAEGSAVAGTVESAAERVTRNAAETESCIFTGDTLFRLSVGRTDLGAGNPGLLRASLARLMKLADNVKVYPGHGPVTTIGYERANNPWLLQIDDSWL
jgi:glyoxylase-like metal-dependent hydrolase (beta-lactamase superfamily II)